MKTTVPDCSTFCGTDNIMKLYKTVLTSTVSLWMKSQELNIEVKPTEQYFLLVLFTKLYSVYETFE